MKNGNIALIMAKRMKENTISGQLDSIVADIIAYIHLSIKELYLKCSVPQDARYSATVDHPYEYSYFP